jgi:hypothetical protein
VPGRHITDQQAKLYRSQPWRCLKKRHDLAVPERLQRVSAPTIARLPLLRGHPGIGILPCAGAGTEPRLGRGGLAGVGSAEVHVLRSSMRCGAAMPNFPNAGAGLWNVAFGYGRRCTARAGGHLSARASAGATGLVGFHRCHGARRHHRRVPLEHRLYHFRLAFSGWEHAHSAFYRLSGLFSLPDLPRSTVTTIRGQPAEGQMPQVVDRGAAMYRGNGKQSELAYITMCGSGLRA